MPDQWQPDWDRHSACTSKIRYATKAAAIRIVNVQSKRRGTKPARPYRCKYCHGFHLTSSPIVKELNRE